MSSSSSPTDPPSDVPSANEDPLPPERADDRFPERAVEREHDSAHAASEPTVGRTADAGDSGVVLYASWRGLGSAVATPAGFVLMGVLASGRFGVSVFTVALTVIGVALAVALLVDYPHATAFDRDGITRHCFARRHRIGWESVDCLDRTPPRTATVLRNMGATSRNGGREVSGGLVARGVGHRRWLLADRVESRDEHDELRSLVRATASDVEVFATRPHASASPTWRYRRRAARS